MGRILKAIWNRQVAKHGSVAALAIGALASALGIPLAPEQVSALIWAGSIVLYILSQLRGLWRPDAPAPKTVQIPTGVKMLLVGALVGSLMTAAPARADQYAITVLHPTQYSDTAAGIQSTDIPAAWDVFTAVDCGPTPQPDSQWSYVITIKRPETNAAIDVPAGFYCAAHTTFTAKGEGAFSAFSAPVQMPAASSTPPPPISASLTATPGAPSLTVARL